MQDRRLSSSSAERVQPEVAQPEHAKPEPEHAKPELRNGKNVDIEEAEVQDEVHLSPKLQMSQLEIGHKVQRDKNNFEN